MEVTFSEGGRYKFACYRLTYEESKSPDRVAKIKADLASKGKDGYSIAITYDASPTPPTWDTFANSLLCLDGRLEMWKLMQESWPHHKAVEAQKGVSKMSTSYFNCLKDPEALYDYITGTLKPVPVSSGESTSQQE